jgi:uncharacterized protein (DUF1697 family)
MHIALLRGINVGKSKPVAMADLVAMMGALGLAQTRTLLRSGNVVFDGGTASPAELEALLEREAAARLGLETLIFVRTAAEWDEALARNPFPEEAVADPGRMLLYALKQAPSPEAIEGLQAAIPGRERVKAWERHAYVYYPDGAGASLLTPALWRRWLPPGTGRNWNTARKLAAMTKS